MAFKVIKRDWTPDDFRCEIMVDSNADFENLPKACVGSVALSPTGDMMIVNASGEWVPFGG